jgi:hypothetical protein
VTEPDDRSTGDAPGNAAVLHVHVTECDECRAAPPPIGRIATLLDAGVVPIDAAALSHRVLLQLEPTLVRLGAAVLWRKVASALLLSLIPLPVVLAYDAYLLRVAYGLASALLPATLAAYLILDYAAILVLVFAATYAAIPVFLANRTAVGRPALG